jgi:IS30 family transposase
MPAERAGPAAAAEPVHNSGRIRNMVMLSERPAEANDRLVVGHWEGDLIIGKDGKSAVGTIVERTTRFLVLFHLPQGRDAESVADALRQVVLAVPAGVFRSPGTKAARRPPRAVHS